MAQSMSTLVSDSSSENSSGAKSLASDNAKNISIEHIDLDELNLIVDGEKLT